jgi:hypothetical protein
MNNPAIILASLEAGSVDKVSTPVSFLEALKFMMLSWHWWLPLLLIAFFLGWLTWMRIRMQASIAASAGGLKEENRQQSP